MLSRGWLNSIVFGATLCVASASVLACLWDRDTLRYEAMGLPGVVEAITGRIERNPPLFYEMRLARVSKELEADPTKLDLYDDAGVACDRLHRDDEAIEWMARKKARLDAIDTSTGEGKEHLYRYHANVGTFLTHRWLRAGADRQKLEDIKAGRDHIAEAIKINPEAHFGREIVQLEAINWIIDDPSDETSPLATFVHRGKQGQDPEKAVKGLIGLMALGDAWESIDVLLAIKFEVASHHDASIAPLVDERVKELLALGRTSLNTTNNEYLKEMPAYLFVGRMAGGPPDREGLITFFAAARANAKEWAAAREAFMLPRLQSGKHPDTDKDFWKGYEGIPALTPPGFPISGELLRNIEVFGAIGALICLPIVLQVRRNRARRKQRLAMPT
jgi:tetratricopeptide (TPR) repeat protein